MDESIQRNIEALLETLGKREHWTWLDPAGPCCKCEERYPQSRERCIQGHTCPDGSLDRVGHLARADR